VVGAPQIGSILDVSQTLADAVERRDCVSARRVPHPSRPLAVGKKHE